MENKLQMSLKKQWFEMTKSGIKTEDYREITPYWITRFVNKPYDKMGYYVRKMENSEEGFPIEFFKTFTTNRMTLGYPKGDDHERIIEFEHAGIEVREGNPEWGAEEGKIYFVIKHGKRIS